MNRVSTSTRNFSRPYGTAVRAPHNDTFGLSKGIVKLDFYSPELVGSSPGLYCFWLGKECLYVAMSANVKRRLERHLVGDDDWSLFRYDLSRNWDKLGLSWYCKNATYNEIRGMEWTAVQELRPRHNRILAKLSDEGSDTESGGAGSTSKGTGNPGVLAESQTKTKHMNDLDGKAWVRDSISVWYQKGLGRNHPHAEIERQHPAPFSYQDIMRLVRFFTKQGDVVLDPFCGVASTLKACALTGRRGIGIELGLRWAGLGMRRLQTEVNCNISQHKIIAGDALRVLPGMMDESMDYIVTSPPYWNVLTKKADHKAKMRGSEATQYGNDPADLGNVPTYGAFLDKMRLCIKHFSRIIKPRHYVTMIVSDFRHKSEYYSFHSDVIDLMKLAGLTLKGITVLVQNYKAAFPYGYPHTYVPNIHHQYIISFRKDE